MSVDGWCDEAVEEASREPLGPRICS
jgi:hypothetical protein